MRSGAWRLGPLAAHGAHAGQSAGLAGGARRKPRPTAPAACGRRSVTGAWRQDAVGRGQDASGEWGRGARGRQGRAAIPETTGTVWTAEPSR